MRPSGEEARKSALGVFPRALFWGSEQLLQPAQGLPQVGGGQLGLEPRYQGLELLVGQVYAGELLQGFHRVVLKALQEGGVLPELGGQLLDLRLDIHAHKYAPFSVRYAGRARRQS